MRRGDPGSGGGREDAPGGSVRLPGVIEYAFECGDRLVQSVPLLLELNEDCFEVRHGRGLYKFALQT